MKTNIHSFKLNEVEHENLLKAMKSISTLINEVDFIENLIFDSVKRIIDYDKETKFNYIFNFTNDDDKQISEAMYLYYGADKMDPNEYELRFNKSDFLREIVSQAVNFLIKEV